MTTRNFRVNNGLSVGDITISASANTITGLATAAPSADGDVANKKYVDDSLTTTAITMASKTLTSPVLNGTLSGTAFLDEDDLTTDSATSVASQQSIKAYVDNGLAGLSQTSISQLNSSVTVADSGTNGAVTIACDGNNELVINDTSATFSGNVVVTGNFTVNGTTTTVATTNTTNTDNIYELATGTTGSPSNDAGIVIERGDSNNAFIGFDESTDKFTVGTGTFTGATSGDLTITTGTLVANLEATTATLGGSDILSTDNTKTLSNKTINLSSNTLTGTFAEFNTAVQDATLVSTTASQTLTNKTLTTPVISTISNTGTLTLPTSSDTLVGRATSDTLTNKTISGSSNTLSNIDNSSLSK